MPIPSKDDIKPITDFRKNAKEIIEQSKITKHPIIITQRGRGTAVIIDFDEYYKKMERLELLEMIAQGKADFLNKNTVTHERAMAALEKCLEEK